ncbi:MAG: DNA polymerase III subunit delta' [Anaerolineaceae bacterium]|nr:MAG: DNA polymerase III subunit delta' [Anaerolineaceae bacterium]
MTSDEGRMTSRAGTGTTTNNWGLLGHEWAVDMLRQHILHDSARHAYLFVGPPGVGRRTLALRFAQALTCPAPAAPAIPCGACRTCKQIEAMQYADLTVIQAEKEGGVLKVEQVREVQHSLALKPYQGKYRVALFLRFQEANANAANALLKTLEEAPAHAILILTADTTEQLLPTIVSRCEILRLRPLPVEAVEAALKGRGSGDAQSRLLAHLSGGRPGAAFRMMGDPSALDFRNERLDDLQRLLSATRVEKFAFAEKLTNRKKEAEERFRDTLLIWLSFWRDVLVSASGSSAPLVNVDRAAQVESLAKQLGLAGARRMVETADKAVEQLEKNVNARLLAEVTLLDLPKSL